MDMAYVTRGMRDRSRDEKYAREVCECGHLRMNHHELRSTFALVDGVIVEVPNPDYRPLEFHCDDADCPCVRKVIVR